MSLLGMTMVSGMKTIQTVLRCPSGKRTGTTSATACRQRWKLFSKEAGEGGETLVDQLRAQNQNRYDYKEFLRKFSVLKEEMKVDMDTFDYIFYNYGMNLYGNMPLIEPLETKEERKVEDFVIVIDTSMSCKGELVRKFLEETYSVL